MLESPKLNMTCPRHASLCTTRHDNDKTTTRQNLLGESMPHSLCFMIMSKQFKTSGLALTYGEVVPDMAKLKDSDDGGATFDYRNAFETV